MSSSEGPNCKYYIVMNVTLEAVSQAGRCAAWLEALAGDEARVRVVTSSGAVTLSSKLLQLFSPLVRETIASVPTQEPVVIIIPDTEANAVNALMKFLLKGEIDASDLGLGEWVKEINDDEMQAIHKSQYGVLKTEVKSVAKCLGMSNMEHFGIDCNLGDVKGKKATLKVRKIVELLKPEVIHRNSKLHDDSAIDIVDAFEDTSNTDFVGERPMCNLGLEQSRGGGGGGGGVCQQEAGGSRVTGAAILHMDSEGQEKDRNPERLKPACRRCQCGKHKLPWAKQCYECWKRGNSHGDLLEDGEIVEDDQDEVVSGGRNPVQYLQNLARRRGMKAIFEFWKGNINSVGYLDENCWNCRCFLSKVTNIFLFIIKL